MILLTSILQYLFMRYAAFLVLIGLLSGTAHGQAYIPMPTDSAYWRYRIVDVDDSVSSIYDFLLLVNGSDTTAPSGRTYHKVMVRRASQTFYGSYIPPVTSLVANSWDEYYGGLRDSAGMIYFLWGSTGAEELIFNYNAAVGDLIPAYSSPKSVTAIDSIFLAGAYHRRFHTTDSAYYTVEGVGSSQGLIPDINDGGTDITFYCFTYGDEIFSPDSSLPCTYIYPIWYNAMTPAAANTTQSLNIYPQPANDVLHVSCGVGGCHVKIINSIGQLVCENNLLCDAEISVRNWTPGLYIAAISSISDDVTVVKKIVISH
jgi:Secretion system C-terminal sorting domain